MNAPFRSIVTAAPRAPLSRSDMQYALMAWRGACLDIFSKIEVAVLETIMLLSKAGFALSATARSPNASKRLEGLIAVLEKMEADKGYAKTMKKRLQAWQIECEKRSWVAHASMSVEKAPCGWTAVFDHRWIEKHEPKAKKIQIRLVEALAILSKLTAEQRALQSQLGQINAMCRKQINPDTTHPAAPHSAPSACAA